MLFHVEMNVRIPYGMPTTEADRIKGEEKARFQELARAGKWRHIWRTVGRYANVSIFDVNSYDELHAILTGLPLFPYMDIKVVAICRHPSSIYDDNR